MPYYRIIIIVSPPQHATHNSNPSPKIIQGIRFIELQNIDVVLNQMRGKAKDRHGERGVIDVEVQMLSKNCSAVLGYLDACEKRREARKDPKVVSLQDRL